MEKSGSQVWHITKSNWYLLPVLALVAFAAAAFVAFFLAMMHSRHATQDVTDPARFHQVLMELGYPTPAHLNVPTLNSFPPDIPTAATHVRFFYRPPFLQGGAQLQLRCGLPASDLRKLLNQVKAVAKDVQSGGDKFDALNAGHGLPSASFRNASNTGFDALPDDFQVFVLDAKDTSGNWDKGWSYGIAVSEHRQEVVYWLEDW